MLAVSNKTNEAGAVLLAACGGWIIRAIEEYGVGGDHQPDTAGFLVAGSELATRIGQALVDAEAAPPGTNAATAIQHVLSQHIERLTKDAGPRA